MKAKHLLSKCFWLCCKTVKRFDLFAQDIRLTYKGESSFSTFIGGLISLIIFTVVGVYSIFLLQVMINRQNANNSKSTEVVNLNTQDEDYYLFDYGFSFGVLVTDTDGVPITLDPSYFTLQIAEGTFVPYGSTSTANLTNLGYKICDLNDLPGLSKEYLERGVNSFMYCPVNKRFRVAGNYLSNNYKYVAVNLNKCVGANCKSDTEISILSNKIVISIVYMSSFMDFNNFDIPVKSYVDDRLSFYLQANYVKIVKMYAKLSKATLDDDYFKIQSPTKKEFFSIERVQNDGTNSNYYIFSAVILMDPNRDLYQRTVFSTLDLFGTIGGIFGLLTSACGLIVGMVSVQIMLSSVFRRLYFINLSQNEEPFDINGNRATSVLHEENKESCYQDNAIHVDRLRNASELNLQIENNKIKENDDLASRLRNTLKNRRKYQPSCIHKILTLVPCSLTKYKAFTRNKAMYSIGEKKDTLKTSIELTL